MIKRIKILLLALTVVLSMSFVSVYAVTTGDPVSKDGFTYQVYIDDGHASSWWLNGYTGSAKNVVIPASLTYDGYTWDYLEIYGEAFKGNTAITAVVVPDNCYGIEDGAFAGCPNLKTYYIKGDNLDSYTSNPGIGVDKNGVTYSGVTVYTKKGSVIDTVIQQTNAANTGGNQIKLVYIDDPYKAGCEKYSSTAAADPTKQMGEDGTAYGKGASAEAVNKAVTSWKKETDPKGTVYNGLQAKITKVTKTSEKLTWKKVKGAKKYVIYGNKCGKTNKLLKQATVTGTSKVFKKVNKKKIKKATYYKFMVVALDKNNKVISSSKIVHAATKGGKVGNDKSVTVKKAVLTKAKKLKKGKTLKLNAKEIAQSKKLKVKRHRAIKYESTNTKIATVSSKGVIKAKKKGTCYVYAYAQNGVSKKIKVVVK